MRERKERILVRRVADGIGTRENVAVTLQDGVIAAIEEIDGDIHPQADDTDGRQGCLVPGFIDIHVHGGAGHYVMDGTMASLDAIAQHLARHGVTGFLATTVTGPWDQQRQALAVTAQAMRDPSNGDGKAVVLGCHLEGPYINPSKKGAQPEAFVRLPDVDELVQECGDHIDALRIVTLAPEMPGGIELTRFLARRSIVPSIGHTNATYHQVSQAIDAGAQHVTHCYNAMRKLDSREPGVVGATMARSELMAELIWDNIHVHPASCRALIQAKGPDGVILISDGIPGAGMGEGYEFSLGDLTVRVMEGSARLPDGTLAGSLLTLDRAWGNATIYDLVARAKMTSYNAARSLGLAHRKGRIAVGYDADLVLIDDEGEVFRTWIGGVPVECS